LRLNFLDGVLIREIIVRVPGPKTPRYHRTTELASANKVQKRINRFRSGEADWDVRGGVLLHAVAESTPRYIQDGVKIIYPTLRGAYFAWTPYNDTAD
jgi:hypothetical protein